MKKLIFILGLLLLISGCESEKDYLSVEILNISKGESSVIVYTVTNESDFDINAYMEFDLVCKNQKIKTTECLTYPAKRTGDFMIFIDYYVESVDAKIKLCK